MRGSKKSRELSAVDLYAAPTKNVNNSTNMDPFDLIRKWEHDTTILYLSNSSFELIMVNGSAFKALPYILIPDSVVRHTLIWVPALLQHRESYMAIDTSCNF